MRTTLAALLLLACALPAAAATEQEDLARYVQIFEGDPAQHSQAADTFSWMGLSDPRLFDLIEKRLIAEYAGVINDRAEKNRVARYIRSLGFSGQRKYLPTIEGLQKHPVYQRYAEDAAEELPMYEKWNPIIANRATFKPGLSDDDNRILNMLRADDLLLKKVGAKRVFFTQTRNPAVVEQLVESLKASYTNADPDYSDAIAWLIKSLAAQNDVQYRPLFEQVAASAPNSKVRSHAAKALASVKP